MKTRKKIVSIVYLCLIFTVVKAQKQQNVYFFKRNGKEVSTKDSADFVRVISAPDSGETDFGLQEYYANGKRKTVGKISAFEPVLVYEGPILRLDSLGKRREITPYEKGMPLGMSYHYFGNGKLYKQIEYLPHTTDINRPDISVSLPFGVNLPDAKYNPNSKLIYFADSLGKVYVENGNGHFLERTMTTEGESIIEGDYKDGVKHGIWKGSEPGFSSSFTEIYEQGKFISGESTEGGITYKYLNAEEPPGYKGGIAKFYQYVSNAIRYPDEALKAGSSGTVVVEFIIEKDGSLSNIGIIRSVSPAIDSEALRVMKSSPKWMTGKVKGIPKRVKFSIPLTFSINE